MCGVGWGGVGGRYLKDLMTRSSHSEGPVLSEVVVPDLGVHEGAGGEELVVVEFALGGVLVEVGPDEGAELGEVDAAPELGDDGVGDVDAHGEAAAAVGRHSGFNPRPEALGVGEVGAVTHVGGEEHVEDVVLEPVDTDVHEGVEVVHDHIAVDGPHVVGGESAAGVDVDTGDVLNILVLREGSRERHEGDEHESSLHSYFIVFLYGHARL